jgi:energy-coupling factor transport system ATP-binding protein
MIDIVNLSYVYKSVVPNGLPIIALDKVSLHVPAGKCLAITGANDCGKTTLCLATGLGMPFAHGTLAGSIHVDGHNMCAVTPGSLAHLIGIVFQDPLGQLFNATIVDEIAWGLENSGLPSPEITERVREALAMVHLDYLAPDRAPHTLSGGEQKRLALAAVLALRPKVLILDELSGGLSPKARIDMVNVLKNLRDKHGVTILLAENDPSVIAALADEIFVLGKGNRIAESRDRGTKCRSENKNLAIECEQLSFAYESNVILNDIHLAIPTGQFFGLIGENGSGKTTLSRLIMGLLRPQKGQIRIFNENTEKQTVGQLAKKIGFAFQNPELQIFCSTVREEIAFGPQNIGMSVQEAIEAVENALQEFDLGELADYPPAALSLSQRRRVALASIAAMNTPILILDEPTVGLDAHETQNVMRWLVKRHHMGTTIMFITHDMDLVESYAEQVVHLS